LILLVNDRQLPVARHSLATANSGSLDRLGGSENRRDFRLKLQSPRRKLPIMLGNGFPKTCS
jgi:hypothetical protein